MIDYTTTATGSQTFVDYATAMDAGKAATRESFVIRERLNGRNRKRAAWTVASAAALQAAADRMAARAAARAA